MSTFPSHKPCNKCKINKPLEEFYIHKRGKYGRKGLCAVCERKRTADWRASAGAAHKTKARARHLEDKYNLTLEEYESRVVAQRHRCAICGVDELQVLNKRLYVDHCHSTGKVRGLLCHMCNSGLGYFKDDVELLDLAKLYLQEYST